MLVRTTPARERWVGRLLLAVATSALASSAIGAVRTKVGHAAATLDDAYIHFQYARAIAEGHPFRYHAGGAASMGATSLLWPAVLAPFWLVGFRGNLIMWPAWGLSFVALALLALEAYRLALPLTGRTPAVAAGAMALVFGGHLWGATSGMEVVPFAWAFARTLRLAAEEAERDGGERSERGESARGRPIELVVFSIVAFLLRPEGAVAAACAAAAIVAARPRSLRSAAWALGPLAVLGAAPLLAAVSTTAQVKLLSASPYLHGAQLLEAVLAQARLFFGTLLNGQVWSAEFLPASGAPVAILSLVATVALGVRARRPWRAAFVVVFALAMLAPCAYVTFLWNRLRYLWPFTTGWLVALACFARLAGDLGARIHPRLRLATPLVAFGCVGLLASKADGVVDDVAGSASGIDRQHVAIGRWVHDHLPDDALVGVNDTGAIAYFGERRTFDVVGLTTPGEGRYWVAGAGPRYEHYERLARAHARLPTHFAVYPEWLACDPVLGAALEEVTVTDATILGGQTMRVYTADWSRLDSGARPWTTLPAGDALADELDVADLESETDHAYELLDARDGETVVREAPGDGPGSDDVVDAGRSRRRLERFVAHLQEGEGARVIVRVECAAPARLHLRAGGVEVGVADVAPGRWTEVAFDLPPNAAKAATAVELSTDDAAAVTVFHYWFYVVRAG